MRRNPKMKVLGSAIMGNGLNNERLISDLGLIVNMAELSAYPDLNPDYQNDAMAWMHRIQQDYSHIAGIDRQSMQEIRMIRRVLPQFQELLEYVLEYHRGVDKLKEVYHDLKTKLFPEY